jgi:hypothetical protein
MHWLLANWPLVLGWVLYVVSDAMPYLPGKAQNVIGPILGVLKALVGSKAKALPPKGDA